MYRLWIVIFSIWSWQTFAQQSIPVDSLYKPDAYYLEDQFYFGMSYIALRNLPENIFQNGFSNAIKFGYIRDLPVNERRNLGFGIGLGMSWDTYLQNLRISIDENTGEVRFKILGENDVYKSNSFTLTKIDIPLEFRWRGSAPDKFKFWRFYAGPVLSYVMHTSSEYINDYVDVQYKDIQIIESWQTGLSLSVGYGTWNFNYYYGLHNIFKNDLQIENQKISLEDMRFGFVYYFL